MRTNAGGELPPLPPSPLRTHSPRSKEGKQQHARLSRTPGQREEAARRRRQQPPPHSPAPSSTAADPLPGPGHALDKQHFQPSFPALVYAAGKERGKAEETLSLPASPASCPILAHRVPERGRCLAPSPPHWRGGRTWDCNAAAAATVIGAAAEAPRRRVAASQTHNRSTGAGGDPNAAAATWALLLPPPLLNQGARAEQGAPTSCPPGRERAEPPRLVGARRRLQTPRPGEKRAQQHRRRLNHCQKQQKPI
uniref:Uncharacterized protein n=1 Tax=Sphaerodactylus townsendi TaxID=933632 RepID=A0ACB8G2B3_9SAUR